MSGVVVLTLVLLIDIWDGMASLLAQLLFVVGVSIGGPSASGRRGNAFGACIRYFGAGGSRCSTGRSSLTRSFQ